MKASNLGKVWTGQTHDLIVMNLHFKLMETGSDIDLKYMDVMILLCTGGFSQLTCASHVPELQISGGIHARGAFPEAWSQLELRSAQCVSVAVLLAKDPAGPTPT